MTGALEYAEMYGDQDKLNPRKSRKGVLRLWLIRGLALICVCSLSTGSHFGSEFLGPLKSSLIRDLHSNNVEFSAILASYSVNNTWTPLVAGLLVTTLGTAWSSLIATSLILLGQFTLFLGRRMPSIGTMAAGLFIFGLGASPLSVIQETIIVRFFSNHGLGLSLALGLVAGKGASFVAALTSYPLAQNHGPLAPFFVATMLAIFSFSINVLYLRASRWLASGSGVEPEVNELQKMPFSSTPITESGALKHVSAKKRVILGDIAKLGDVFWLYLVMNFLCGTIWKPFMYMAPNIIQLRYGYSESDAGEAASLLHAGGVVMYPICGFLADRFRRDAIVYKLSMLASLLTLSSYIWFLLPPTWTKSALPGVLFFGTGLGFGPLLLVLMVPQIVPSAYIATALGAHKSIESAGSTIAITLAGIILDEKIFKRPPKPPLGPSTPIPSLQELPATNSSHQGPIHRLLFVFAFLNFLQLACIMFLWKLDISKRGPNGYQILSGDMALPYEGGEREENYLDREAEHDYHLRRVPNRSPIDTSNPPADRIPSASAIPNGLRGDGEFVVTEAEIARGKILFRISIGLVVAAWMFYSITLVTDLIGRQGDE